MRNSQLLHTLLPVLLAGACVDAGSDQSSGSLDGPCSHCQGGDDDGGGGGGGSDDGSGGTSDDGGGGGGSSGDVDVDIGANGDVHFDASLQLEVIGTGIYVGLFPLGCLDLSGEFSANAHATASFDNDAFVIANVDATASIDVGSGCSCSGINASAIASINVNASIDASLAACTHACDGHGDSCMQSCNQAGNTIVAHAALDAGVCAAVSIGGALDLDALVGANVDLQLDAVVDVNGHVVVDL